MDKREKKSKYAHGALILLVGGIICKLLGGFYRIPLSNILGAEGIGVYQLIFPIYSLFLIFISGGIPIALSKLIAECRARGENKRGKRFLLQSVIYLSILSIIFSILFFLFAGQLAAMQGNSQARLGYFAVGAAIIFASILTAFRGYFQGYQNMTPTAVSQIIEQLFKLVLGLILASIFIKINVAYGVLGAILGVMAGEIIALFYLVIMYIIKKRNIDILKPEKGIGNIKFKDDFKLLFKKSLPITLNSFILPLIIAIDSFLVINLLLQTGIEKSISTQMFGIYSGMVNSLINLPTIVSIAMAVSLIPAISYKKEVGESTSDLLSSTFKIVLFISVPTIFIFTFFSNDIMNILYPNTTSLALLGLGANLLKISAINIFYISVLQITTAILQANNKGVISLINLSVSGSIKVILTYFLVLSPLNICGAAISSILCFALTSGLNLISIKNEFNFEIKFKNIANIFICSAIALGTSLSLKYLFSLFISTNFSVILSLLISAIIYLILIIFLPVFEDKEFDKIPYGGKLNNVRNKMFWKIKNRGLEK